MTPSDTHSTPRRFKAMDACTFRRTGMRISWATASPRPVWRDHLGACVLPDLPLEARR